MKFEFPLEIVLIDDEQDIVELMELAVEQVDELKGVGFTDSEQALEYIKENRVRAIFTDIIMPGLRGDELIQICKSLPWNIDIVVMTGIANKEVAYDCFNSGAREVLIKPVEIHRMVESLNRVVDRYKVWHRTYDLIAS